MMDKLRSIASKPLEFFGGRTSKHISADEAAADLVGKLMPQSSGSDGNSSSFNAKTSSETSEAAAKTLQAIYGGNPTRDADITSVLENINVAREEYIEISGSKDRKRLAEEFNEALKNNLVGKLGERMQPLYLAQVKRLNAAFAGGKATRHECDQEMAQFLKEAMTVGCLLAVEVEGALSFIRDTPMDVTNGMFYLFGGHLVDNKNEFFEKFDRVRDDALAVRFNGSADSEEAKIQFGRAFAAEARRQLANRLPNDFKNDYFKLENALLEDLRSGKIDYENYRAPIEKFFVRGQIETAINKILVSLNDQAEYKLELLAHLCNASDKRGSSQLYIYPNPNSHRKLHSAIIAFMEAGREYMNSTPDSKGQEAKYEELVSRITEKLLQSLPDEPRMKITANRDILRNLERGKIIDEDHRKDCEGQFIKELIVKRHGSKSVSYGGRNSIVPYRKNIEAADAADKGLAASFKGINKTKDSLEALIMCWGGNVEWRADSFRLIPLCEEKKKYFELKNIYTSDPLTKFHFDDAFSIEARVQLCDKLPDPLKKKYSELDQFLFAQCEKETITVETYKDTMVKFLKREFEDPKNVY